MPIPASIQKQLPKAAWLSLSFDFKSFYFAKFRLANAARWQIGWVTVQHRLPWLERSARALHPQLFTRGTAS